MTNDDLGTLRIVVLSPDFAPVKLHFAERV
jgi:hypothetical protein